MRLSLTTFARYSAQVMVNSGWWLSSSRMCAFGRTPAKARTRVASDTPERRASAFTPATKASNASARAASGRNATPEAVAASRKRRWIMARTDATAQESAATYASVGFDLPGPGVTYRRNNSQRWKRHGYEYRVRCDRNAVPLCGRPATGRPSRGGGRPDAAADPRSCRQHRARAPRRRKHAVDAVRRARPGPLGRQYERARRRAPLHA